MENYKKNIKNKYTFIANKFIEEKKKKIPIICVLITGSYYSGRLTKKSDLDIFLITDNTLKIREKGIKTIDNVKVSYFMNPYFKIQELLKEECKKLKRPTAEFVYFSECISGKDIAVILQKLANKAINFKLPKLSKKDTLYFGWKLNDKSEILKRKNYSKTNKEYLKYDLFDNALEIFFLIKRSYKPNAKYVLKKISSLDSYFFKLVSRYLDYRSDKNLNLLVQYLLKILKFECKNYSKKDLIKI